MPALRPQRQACSSLLPCQQAGTGNVGEGAGWREPESRKPLCRHPGPPELLLIGVHTLLAAAGWEGAAFSCFCAGSQPPETDPGLGGWGKSDAPSCALNTRASRDEGRRIFLKQAEGRKNGHFCRHGALVIRDGMCSNLTLITHARGSFWKSSFILSFPPDHGALGGKGPQTRGGVGFQEGSSVSQCQCLETGPASRAACLPDEWKNAVRPRDLTVQEVGAGAGAAGLPALLF